MKTLKSFRFIVAWLLVLLLAVPFAVLAQDSKAAAGKKFSQEALDQMLAPVALYPDSLLAQVLMASTYPLEVVMADRWVKQNKNLTGDKLKEAVDKQPWDPSVKALMPFPDLLSTMAEKLDWTEKLGDAFLAQQAEVMETVQSLRKKAYEAGNLKSTKEQEVIVEREIIRVEPADPRVVYVPVYDPWWVYGPWWWPYYPPYAFYPYSYPAGAVVAPGFIGFGVGFFIGSFWGHWGYCDWHHHHVYVHPYYYGRPYHGYRTAPIGGAFGSVAGAPAASSPVGSAHATQRWAHDPSHRRGVAYRDPAVRDRFRQVSRTPVENRRVSRGFEDNMAKRTAVTKGDAIGRTTGGAYAPIDKHGKPDVSVSRTAPDRQGVDRKFEGNRSGRSYPTVERNGRIDTSSTPRKALERRGADRQAIGAYSPAPQRGAVPSAPEGVNRGVTVPKPGNLRREALPPAKSQNWTGVLGGQDGGGSTVPNRGSGWSGGGSMGGGGGAVPRGGSAGSGGGGHIGGAFRGGR
jgi:hypothetical protein